MVEAYERTRQEVRRCSSGMLLAGKEVLELPARVDGLENPIFPGVPGIRS